MSSSEESTAERAVKPATTHFDPDHKLVTSYLLPPTVLAGLRLLFAIFTLVTALYTLIWQAVKLDIAEGHFSYFTNLTWVGLCAYFWASGVQTYAYTRSVKKGYAVYPLQRWWRVFQYLHVLLLSTIVTYPLLVTIVYWALLASSESFATPYSSYSNIAKHALNSVLALFEILLTNVGTMPWWDLPVTVLLLGGYVGVAYITHKTQGFYPYSFLNPKKEGKMLAAYVVGIAVGQAVLFAIVWGIIKLRERLVNKNKTEEVSVSEKEQATNDEKAAGSGA